MHYRHKEKEEKKRLKLEKETGSQPQSVDHHGRNRFILSSSMLSGSSMA